MRHKKSGRVHLGYTKQYKSSPTGYKIFRIQNQNGRKEVRIHRLVASTFIPNPENKPQVDHINGNTLDNRVSNLKWVTNFENSRNPNTSRCKTIYQYSLENEFLKEYDSINQAALENNCDNRNISNCANKNKNSLHYTSHSFKWSFVKY